jgi:KDO2-lipid IV(A) lauroyltransferase
LPLTVLAPIGEALGMLFYALGRERRMVAQTNIALCFPELGKAARRTLVRRHFCSLGRGILERCLLWWASRDRIARLIHVEGLEHCLGIGGRPVIWLAPHFVGLEMGGARIQLEHAPVSMYSRQKNAIIDAMLLRGRTRFARAPIFSRQEGIRPIIRALRKGSPLYYLPDMDFGARDAVFAPFFGVPAATITALSRIAALAGASVVPCVTRQLPGGAGYGVRFYPPWEGFPSGDMMQDVRRMNAFIEERVREMPEQYYWVHKRFKTRAPGEPRFYD